MNGFWVFPGPKFFSIVFAISSGSSRPGAPGWYAKITESTLGSSSASFAAAMNSCVLTEPVRSIGFEHA